MLDTRITQYNHENIFQERKLTTVLAMLGKIVKDRDELARKIEELKKQGKRIVLTNGGFNLLHVGHIRSLFGAKEHGDIW